MGASGGTTGRTITGADGSGSAVGTPNPGGFGNNPFSLSGQIAGLGRYYFGGNGKIVGSKPPHPALSAA
jgi:hypothetical protein